MGTRILIVIADGAGKLMNRNFLVAFCELDLRVKSLG